MNIVNDNTIYFQYRKSDALGVVKAQVPVSWVELPHSGPE